jgi:predicted membrane protein
MLRGTAAYVVAPIVAVLIGLAAWTEFNHAASLVSGSDMDAYWEAALRLRAGEPLYRAGIETDSDLYRYAPWFAIAWIPLTHLPKDAVLLCWTTLCLGAAIASVAPLAREGVAGWAALAFLLPFQLEGAAYGNVQPLLVLALLWGVPRRSGPAWIALGASLKGVPLMLAVVYAGRGEWKRALVTVALTAVLVLPMLLFDLSDYSTEIGSGQMSVMQISPVLFAVVALVAVAVTYRYAETRFAWLIGSVATMLVLPRFLLYQISFVVIGLARDGRGR